jgi:hypothetical protein
MNRTKPALNAFAITFEGRISPTTTNDTDATYTARLTLPVNGS